MSLCKYRTDKGVQYPENNFPLFQLRLKKNIQILNHRFEIKIKFLPQDLFSKCPFTIK